MFSLHSFFLLFFPTSAFVPATVFWLPFFLLWACLSPWLRWPSQLTFFLISAPLWQRADTTWGDLQAVTGYCTRSKSASSIWGLSQFHMQGTTWHLPASASSITNTHTYTHTHTHTHTAVGFSQLWTGQCSTETHQNTWKWQREHQEPVSNDIFNHQGFPSKPCLSVFSNC